MIVTMYQKMIFIPPRKPPEIFVSQLRNSVSSRQNMTKQGPSVVPFYPFLGDPTSLQKNGYPYSNLSNLEDLENEPQAVILINEPELKITYQGQIAKEAWSEGRLGPKNPRCGVGVGGGGWFLQGKGHSKTRGSETSEGLRHKFGKTRKHKKTRATDEMRQPTKQEPRCRTKAAIPKSKPVASFSYRHTRYYAKALLSAVDGALSAEKDLSGSMMATFFLAGAIGRE